MHFAPELPPSLDGGKDIIPLALAKWFNIDNQRIIISLA